MIRIQRIIFICLWGLLSVAGIFCPRLAALDVRNLIPRGMVNDYAGIINNPDRVQLETVLRSLEQKTAVEVTVVTLSSLEGEALEDFAVKLFAHWGIGKRGSDNGVLLLFTEKERQIRIEVGYGLEAVLPDGLCGEIIRKYMLPDFQRGNYSAGLRGGTLAVVTVIARAEGISPAELNFSPPSATSSSETLFSKVFIFIFLLLLFIIFVRHPFLFLLFFGGFRDGFGGGFSGGRGGFGGFGGGMSGGGGASGHW